MIFLTDSSQWKEHWSSPHTLRQNHDFSVHLKNSSNCYIYQLNSAIPSQFDELFSNCNITWKIRQTTTHFNEKVQNQVNLTNYFQNSNITWKICCFSVCFAKYERIFIKAEFSPRLFPYLDAFNTKGKKTMRFPRQKTNEVALSSI